MKFRVCASFNADFPVDAEFDRPEGCYLARRFVQSLRTAHFDVGEFDNWRDCGWSVPCNVNEARWRLNEDPRKSGISSTSLLEWPTDAVK